MFRLVARGFASPGLRLLTKVDIKTVLEAFLDTQVEDLILVKRTYTEAARTAIKPIYGKDEDGQPIKIEGRPPVVFG